MVKQGRGGCLAAGNCTAASHLIYIWKMSDREIQEQSVPLAQRLGRAEVARVVARFYQRVPDDAQLAPFFNSIGAWPEHEARVVEFWWGVLGGSDARPSPDAMRRGHQSLVMGERELQAWLTLFSDTLYQELDGELATQWDGIATAIAERMRRAGMIQSD